MNILSYKDVENYLQNKQVYFKKGIVDIDFKTIAESGKVHNIGEVELRRIRDDTVTFTIVVNGLQVTMYEYMSDLELFDWVKTDFIPVNKMVERWML